MACSYDVCLCPLINRVVGWAGLGWAGWEVLCQPEICTFCWVIKHASNYSIEQLQDGIKICFLIKYEANMPKNVTKLPLHLDSPIYLNTICSLSQWSCILCRGRTTIPREWQCATAQHHSTKPRCHNVPHHISITPRHTATLHHVTAQHHIIPPHKRVFMLSNSRTDAKH